MIDEKDLILLHRMLDGEASPDERARIESLRALDPEMNQLYNDLGAALLLMAQVDTETPSPNLKKRIMNALPAARYTYQKGTLLGSFFVSLWEAIRVRPALGYAYATVLGIMIGVVGYALLPGIAAGPEPGAVSGSMTPTTVTQKFTIDVDGLHGTVMVTTDAAQLLVQLRLSPRAETEVRLSFPPGRIQWQSLRRLEGTAQGTLRASQEDVFLLLSGDSQYDVAFDKTGPASLTLTLLQDGKTVYRQSLLPMAAKD